MLRKKQANLSYLVAVVPTYDNVRDGFRGCQKRQTPKHAGSGQLPPELIFCFLPFFPFSLSLPIKKFDKTKILF